MAEAHPSVRPARPRRRLGSPGGLGPLGGGSSGRVWMHSKEKTALGLAKAVGLVGLVGLVEHLPDSHCVTIFPCGRVGG